MLSIFFFPEWSLLFTLLVLPITVFELFDLSMKKNMVIYIVLGIGLIVSGFVFALLYPLTPSPNQLSLLYVLFAVVTIIDIIFNYCLKVNAYNIK